MCVCLGPGTICGGGFQGIGFFLPSLTRLLFFSLCWVWGAREAACVRSFEDRSAERRAHSKAPTSQPATTRSEQKKKHRYPLFGLTTQKTLGNLVQIIGPCAMIRQTFVFSETALPPPRGFPPWPEQSALARSRAGAAFAAAQQSTRTQPSKGTVLSIFSAKPLGPQPKPASEPLTGRQGIKVPLAGQPAAPEERITVSILFRQRSPSYLAAETVRGVSPWSNITTTITTTTATTKNAH